MSAWRRTNLSAGAAVHGLAAGSDTFEADLRVGFVGLIDGDLRHRGVGRPTGAIGERPARFGVWLFSNLAELAAGPNPAPVPLSRVPGPFSSSGI